MTDNAANKTHVGKLTLKHVWLVLKWVIMFAAYGYMAVVLVRFDKYDALWAYWEQMSALAVGWLLLVFLLLPFNWLFESMKWKFIVSKTENISLFHAFKAVMAGYSTGFFTPYRAGEFAGRIMFLKKENRKTGVIYSVVNSLTQNVVLVLCGLPASIIYFITVSKGIDMDLRVYFLALVAMLIALLAFYFALPRLAKTKLWKRYLSFSTEITHYAYTDLLRILFYSLARYVVFCIQFYAILQFFGVDMQPWQALLAIPTNYLFVTFTPSVAFSEAAIRGSYAVFFISAFTPQVAGIAFAGISLWLINFGIPMLAGSVLMVKKTV